MNLGKVIVPLKPPASFWLKMFCLFGTLLIFSNPGYAEPFYETNPGVFQKLREKIVVSYDKPGIFILATVPTGLQEFNLTNLENDIARHIFIEYDPASNRYSQLIVGQKVYRINGSFTAKMSRMRISVDNINPYLTVVVEEDQAIVGFKGLQTIINATGEAALTFSEANQLDEYSDLIVPYSLKKRNETQILMLKDKEVTSGSIGLSLKPPRNPCTSDKALFLDEDQVARVRQIKDSASRVAFLKDSFRKNTEVSPLADTLRLKVTRDALIYLDYNDVLIKRVIPKDSKFEGQTVCVVNTFQID